MNNIHCLCLCVCVNKEWVVEALNNTNQTTLMCGDGTNDMGALKKAHVGISLMNNPELEQRTNVKVAISESMQLQQQQQQQQQQGVQGGMSSLTKSLLEAEAVAEIDRMDPTIVQVNIWVMLFFWSFIS
jgi:manganese-transporting P-type ATPase